MAGKASPSDYKTTHKERSRKDQNSKGQRRHARFHVISITATRQSVLVSSIIKTRKIQLESGFNSSKDTHQIDSTSRVFFDWLVIGRHSLTMRIRLRWNSYGFQIHTGRHEQ